MTVKAAYKAAEETTTCLQASETLKTLGSLYDVTAAYRAAVVA